MDEDNYNTFGLECMSCVFLRNALLPWPKLGFTAIIDKRQVLRQDSLLYEWHCARVHCSPMTKIGLMVVDDKWSHGETKKADAILLCQGSLIEVTIGTIKDSSSFHDSVKEHGKPSVTCPRKSATSHFCDKHAEQFFFPSKTRKEVPFKYHTTVKSLFSTSHNSRCPDGASSVRPQRRATVYKLCYGAVLGAVLFPRTVLPASTNLVLSSVPLVQSNHCHSVCRLQIDGSSVSHPILARSALLYYRLDSVFSKIS